MRRTFLTDDYANIVNSGVRQKRLNASPKNGFPRNFNILLWSVKSGPDAFSGGDDKGDACHEATIDC